MRSKHLFKLNGLYGPVWAIACFLMEDFAFEEDVHKKTNITVLFN